MSIYSMSSSTMSSFTTAPHAPHAPHAPQVVIGCLLDFDQVRDLLFKIQYEFLEYPKLSCMHLNNVDLYDTLPNYCSTCGIKTNIITECILLKPTKLTYFEDRDISGYTEDQINQLCKSLLLHIIRINNTNNHLHR